MVKAAADQPYTPPQLVSSPAINPSIDLSVNDVAYLSFTNPAGGGGGDVVVARKDRKATAFGVVPAALDINPAAPAGIDTGRSKVAVAADGVALVVWGESGQVFARRVFERSRLGGAAAGSVPAAGPFPGSPPTSPDVDVQDDSSFAWVVFREVFLDAPGGHSRATRAAPRRIRVRPARRRRRARRLPVAGLRRAAAGRHQRARRRLRRDAASSVAPFGAVLKDKIFNAGVAARRGRGGGRAPGRGDGRERRRARRVAELRPDDPRARLHGRPREPCGPGARSPRSRSRRWPPGSATRPTASRRRRTAPATSPSRSCWARPGAQGVFVGSFDRAPGAFRLSSGTSFRNAAHEPAEVVAVVRALGAADVRGRGRRPGRRDDDGDVARGSRGPGRRPPLAGHRDRPPRPGHRDLAPHPAPGRDAAARAGHGLGHAPPRPGREGDGAPDGRQPGRTAGVRRRRASRSRGATAAGRPRAAGRTATGGAGS